MCAHVISDVIKDSPAGKAGVKPGERLVSINGEVIEDIFDYQYLGIGEQLTLSLESEDGSQRTAEINKDEDEDLGLIFDNGLMDDYRHCTNKCIFCFIDQMPPGMRENLYFKDDDSRLSFLQGNYITLTNMSEHNVDRIIKYRLSPINISFQTMNPKLRCMMLNNRFAGEALAKVDRFYEAGILMNGQIVLCKGVNDGDELEYSLKELYKYVPVLESLSVVPVGLSKFREGLYPLEPFNKEDACRVIDKIESWQKKAYEEHGIHFVHASDEWYIMAGRELPEEERYDGYLQLENGVGMLRSIMVEFEDSLREYADLYGKSAGHSLSDRIKNAFKRLPRIKEESITMITGRLAAPYLERMCAQLHAVFPQRDVRVLAIRNDFFGEMITVSGLLTGQDILAQCMEAEAKEELGDKLILPQNVVQADSELLLDDYVVDDLRRKLGKEISVVPNDGYSLLKAMLGIE
ncbi:MAG: DUF512 domain-containing protein [Lachnospiraceae bacterium]|nr:DUF512 domain-containing protein [Lachnospiraceae bacterium]